MAILLCGCLSVQKAQQVVLENTASFNSVGATWLRLNPCIIDTAKKIVVHKTDTTTLYDSAYWFYSGHLLTDSVNGQVVDTILPAALWNKSLVDTITLRITKTVRIHDTTIVDITDVDASALASANDSTQAYKLLLANQAGQTTAANANTSTVQAKYTRLIWIDVIAGILIAAGAFCLIYFKL